MSDNSSPSQHSCLDPNERSRMENEIKKLKEMLSIHLDLIQHQADQAATRETQVKALRRENDLLLQKVERMERRLAVPVRSPPVLSSPLHVDPPLPAPPPPPLAPATSVVRMDAATSPRPRPLLSTIHTQTTAAQKQGRYTQTEEQVVEEKVAEAASDVCAAATVAPRPPMCRRGRPRAVQSPPPPPPPLQPAPSLAVRLSERTRAQAQSDALSRRLSELQHRQASPPAAERITRRLAQHLESKVHTVVTPDRPRRQCHQLEPVSLPQKRLLHETTPAPRPRRLSHHAETPASVAGSGSPVLGSHSLRPRKANHCTEPDSVLPADSGVGSSERDERCRQSCSSRDLDAAFTSTADDWVWQRTRASVQEPVPGAASSPARCRDAAGGRSTPSDDSAAVAAGRLDYTVSAENRRLQRRLARRASEELARPRKCLLVATPYHQFIPTLEEVWDEDPTPAVVSSTSTTAEPTERPQRASRQQIEIPRWTERPLAASDGAAGVENLDDSVFAKRHAKLELDEKRRKRWDLQRLREQRAYEKLKQSYTNRARAGRPSQTGGERQRTERPLTLRPAATSALYIQVSSRIPVCAFGTNVPPLTPRDFQLPWAPGKPPPANAGGARADPRPTRR